MPDDFKKILIIKPSSLGDIILALPALSALRRSFPDAEISWLIRPEFATLIENHPHIDRIIIFDRKFLGKALQNAKAFAALLSLISGLRKEKFDAVFDFQGLFRTGSLAWLADCKNRFGMTPAREHAYFFYTEKVPQDADCIHLVDYYLKIVKTAGASDTDVRFVLPIAPAAADAANRLLTTHKIALNNYVVLVPGSAHPDKCWPVERFAKLAEKIHADFGLSIVATGIDSEKPMLEKLARLADIPITNLAGRTTISELAALLKSARLVVSNDTGTGHIAAALATPTVIIFGRSNPARVQPYARRNCIAAIEPYARGLKPDSPDPKHHIKNVTLDHVYEVLKTHLQPKPANRNES